MTFKRSYSKVPLGPRGMWGQRRRKLSPRKKAEARGGRATGKKVIDDKEQEEGGQLKPSRRPHVLRLKNVREGTPEQDGFGVRRGGES